MGQIGGRIRDAGEGTVDALSTGGAVAGLEQSAGGSTAGAAFAAAGAPPSAVPRLSRGPIARTVRLVAVTLALFPAAASFTKCDPAPADARESNGQSSAIADDSVVSDSILRLGRWQGSSTRLPDKVPLAIRKHSRRFSPSDQDGTSPDPTDDDETSDDVVGNDDTELVVALWSAPLVCVLIASERDCEQLCPATTTPLYLAHQRFRC
jgi:hypothetical protein